MFIILSQFTAVAVYFSLPTFQASRESYIKKKEFAIINVISNGDKIIKVKRNINLFIEKIKTIDIFAYQGLVSSMDFADVRKYNFF